MPRHIIQGCLVGLLAVMAAASPVSAQTGRARPTGAVSQGRILFQRAFQRLEHARRFQFQETQAILRQIQKVSPATTRYTIAFLAPNRMATTLHTSHAIHGVAQVQSIQVGRTKCQRATSWVCFPSAAPNPASLIKELISPRMSEVTFRTTTASIASGRKVTVVQISWRGHGFVYSASLVLQPKSGLPLTFRSTVRQGGEIEIEQNSSFDYSHPLSIRLPHAKRVA